MASILLCIVCVYLCLSYAVVVEVCYTPRTRFLWHLSTLRQFVTQLINPIEISSSVYNLYLYGLTDIFDQIKYHSYARYAIAMIVTYYKCERFKYYNQLSSN